MCFCPSLHVFWLKRFANLFLCSFKGSPNQYVLIETIQRLSSFSLKKKGIKNLVMYEATGRVGGKNLDLTLNGVTHNYMALGPSYFKTFLPLAKVKSIYQPYYKSLILLPSWSWKHPTQRPTNQPTNRRTGGVTLQVWDITKQHLRYSCVWMNLHIK